MIPSYDAFKLCAPEDEPGYWLNHPPESEESDEPEPWPDDERAEAEADQ